MNLNWCVTQLFCNYIVINTWHFNVTVNLVFDRKPDCTDFDFNKEHIYNAMSRQIAVPYNLSTL